jgi:hypothetical protein
MFSIKAFKLLKSNAWYLWCFHVKRAKDIETESTISLPDNQNKCYSYETSQCEHKTEVNPYLKAMSLKHVLGNFETISQNV